MITLEGLQHKTIFVEDDNVRISKGGIFGKREKTIPIRNISAVDIKKPGPVFNGYIQFVIPGGQHLNSSYKVSGGTMDAVNDENSVVFSGMKKYQIALDIKTYIENHQSSAQSPVAKSAADEILKYKNLLDIGAITQEQYDLKVKELL